MAHLQVEGLWYGYRQGVPVLRGIDLDIPSGQFVALIGQNGAGKSTFAKHLNGVHRPSQGRVLVDGQDILGMTVAQIAVRVGYCYQNPDHQIFHQTIYDEVAFGPRNLGLTAEEIERRVEDALTAVGLWEERQESPLFAGKGERQRVAVASVLAMSPGVIVLDEPTTGLDWAGAREMMSLVTRLNAEGRTIIMITHDMRLVADYASRVIVLGQGKVLLDGAPAQVFAQEETLRSTALQPPQIVRLGAALRPGQPPVLTVERLASLLEVVQHAPAATVEPLAAPARGAAPESTGAPPPGYLPGLPAEPGPTEKRPGNPPGLTLPADPMLHPTARLLTMGALMLLPFFTQLFWVLVIMFGAAVVAARLAGLSSAGWKGWRILGLLGGVITFLMWIPLMREGTPIWTATLPGMGWQLTINDMGFTWGAVMGLRIATASLVCLGYVLTTSPRQITAGLRGLGLPYPIAYLISLAFRLLQVSQRDAAVIREVQAVRGLDINQGSIALRVRRYAAILGPLVLLALRRVQLIANALDARGFRMRGGRHRLYRMPLWKPSDVAVVALCVSLLVAAVYLRVKGVGVLLHDRL